MNTRLSRISRKRQSLPIWLVVFFVVALTLPTFAEEPADKHAQIDMFIDLGVLKYGKADASGTREILILTKDNTGVFTHQHLTRDDNQSFEAILQARGLIQIQENDQGKKEKHLMVFNSKDAHTYVWVPFSKLKETRERIKKTGKTLPMEGKPERAKETDLMQLDFELSE